MKKILLLLISLYSFSFSFDSSTFNEYKTFGYWSTSFSSGVYDSCQGGSAVSYESGGGWMRQTFYIPGSESSLSEPGNQICNTYDSWKSIMYTALDRNNTAPICNSGDLQLDGNLKLYECFDNNTYEPVTEIENGFERDNGELVCNEGATQSLGGCKVIQPHSDGFTPDGEPTCISPYVLEYGFCIIPDNTEPDGTCSDGFNKDLNNNCIADTSGGDTSGGDTSGGSGGDTSGGDTSGGSGGDTSGGSGGDTSGGDTSGGSGVSGGSGGSGVSGGSGGSIPDDTIPSDSSNVPYMCSDGGKSSDLSTPGLQTCDRTCESVGLITVDGKCSSKTDCASGEVKSGTDLLGYPICYKPSSNVDVDLNTVETLLGDIKTNTSTNKNSNEQLGNVNNNVIKSTAKLQAIKGGLAIINSNITGTNGKLEAIKGGMALNNTALNKINDSTSANTGILEGIATMLSDLFTTSDEKINSLGSSIEGNLSSTLSGTFEKYSNVLGFGSSFGSTPSNVDVVLFGKRFTLLDYDFLEPFISVIRSLFLSLAYLMGFMFFLRSR